MPMKLKPILLVAASMLLLVTSRAIGAEKPKSQALSSPNLVWAGLDYTRVKMIGPGQFNDAKAIFPGMLNEWNNLFLRERIKPVEKVTRKHLLLDVAGVYEKNKQASASQIIMSEGPDDVIEKSHISADDIAATVKSCKLENKEGLGAIFIADRFVKHGNKGVGAVYVVAFDVDTREVIFSERVVNKAGGFGFRNFWFHVIKLAEPVLSKCR